jgi:deoxyribodipyrimidine photo-lyase
MNKVNMEKASVMHWFRQDLRLRDNPALCCASDKGPVLPVFIDDPAMKPALGACSRVWLHHALHVLAEQLEGALVVGQGDPLKLLTAWAARCGIKTVCWNRSYDPWVQARDERIKRGLEAAGLCVFECDDALLWDPNTVAKKDGTPYKVFSFYKKACYAAPPPRALRKKPSITLVKRHGLNRSIASLGLLPDEAWHDAVIRHWSVGEEAAHAQWRHFLKHHLNRYQDQRDYPALDEGTSRLSPYLHFGHITPHRLWYDVLKQTQNAQTACFLSELVWREFSYALLLQHPSMHRDNMKKKFDAFPWRQNRHYVKAWKEGKTGYPIVDAGMRQLYETGFMHNRVRMITASFLIKNLNIHWKEGAAWFWTCLFDADRASNSAGWQWVAGSGADAAPFFRIFNPILQAKKYDPQGLYIKRYLPELASLPVPYLFEPSCAPDAVLKKAGVVLGRDYPKPMVSTSVSRLKALEAYRKLGKA